MRDDHQIITTTFLMPCGNMIGNKSPEAIKDFLASTKGKWQRSPRFVLLVGDASFDPRNYLGLGDMDYVPQNLLIQSIWKLPRMTGLWI